ncbi:MAG: choloylglycine hydrolase family protein [Desulfarculaceae bacterium]|nr:choloylglycine hydrolase family protein [Desulfarculaceae bacterium]MCF8048681.1 choloylglycine hydrolase family protein [Desulfarculaceae bacterium]MCF8096428.1 choloylglycine hydrolase family protein [Desulfarculaceae bacterium]MCF8121893.1 choloylglycine hydrolase family protein [Desulfarculaceae bacterium]
MKFLGFLLGVAAAAILAVVPAAACTGITIHAQDGAVVHARTMEFGIDLQSQVLIIPRGYAISATGPGNKPGLKWKAKYAAMGMDAFGLTALADGMNEKGLAAGMFYFTGFAKYPEAAPADQAKCLAPWEVSVWILTNFESVAQVKAALPKVKVWPASLAQMGPGPLGIHYIVTDKQGNSMVVEYVDGKLHMYDDPLGVITNAPTFDWHMMNLRNYVNLSANNVPQLDLKNFSIYPTGQGSGMLGLPGDVTPPSRLIRAVAFSQAVLPSPNGEEAVMSALRLLDSFFISKGMARAYKDGKVGYDITEWMDACDLKNLKFYFSTYDNLTPKVVDMNKLDLDAKKLQRIPINSGPRFTDVTGLVK